jgi:hypothetical protein
MNDESDLLNLLIDEDNMAEVELNCTAPDCTSGVAGACWKTPKLPSAVAMTMLQLHHGDGDEEAGWKSCLAQQFQLEVTRKTISSSFNSGTGTRGPRGRPTSTGTS